MPYLSYQIEGEWFRQKLDKREITIGRSGNNDVVIKHQSISRRHAKLFNDGTAWRIVDLGSTYGTRVNDLAHADKALADGDRVFLHHFPLMFTENLEPETPGASLIDSGGSEQELGATTVVQSAVDFSSLASGSHIQHLQKLLAVVTKTSAALLVSTSLDETLHKVLDLVFEHLPVQRGFIMLWDDETQDLTTRAVKSNEKKGDGEIRFSRTIAQKVFGDKVGVLTTDAQIDERFADGGSIIALGIRSAMAAPIWSGDQVEGLIYVDTPLQAKAFDKFDLDLLSALGNHVAVAIEQARLQSSVIQQRLVRRRLERYHSPAVIERITSSSHHAGDTLMAEEREATVLFADLVAFTKRCEGMQPREIAELLNRYFSEMSEVVFLHEGTLDKFIGDALMAVFGAPLATPDHPQRAVDAGLEMRDGLALLNEGLPAEERLEFRIGIHSGHVVAGDIGSPRRSDYTVLGATVNLAARLESIVAKPGQIVISDATRSALPEGYETGFVGEHQPKGISRPLRCYEVLGRS